ncbi:MAG: sensor domain-containing diguanylate cyclase [Gemmatimonas sp.]
MHLALIKVAEGRFIIVATDAASLADARGMGERIEQQLRAVDGAVRDYAIFTVTASGYIESWNESAERVHQWPASDIVGQPFAMLLPDSGNSETHVRDTLALASRNGWCEEEGYRARHDGTTFWANTVITALRVAGGEAVSFSVITRDLSERRKLDEATREDAASATDYLTGVSTRRAFFDVAGSEVARGRRYGQSLTLLLVQADHYRDRVEAHGEPFSDEWLRAIAWVCRQESRTTDVVGRVGGEEFAVLLPSTELSGGLVLAERIRERMQRHVFQGDYQSVRCTVSVGVAELSDSITSVDGLITASGTAVERAHQAGRNLVVGYDA